MSSKISMIISMCMVVAAGFIVNYLFPAIPGYIYLIGSIIFGLLILSITKFIENKKKEVNIDERLHRHAKSASYLLFRFTYPACLFSGIVLTILNSPIIELKITGYVLLAIGIFQGLSFSVIYEILKRRN